MFLCTIRVLAKTLNWKYIIMAGENLTTHSDICVCRLSFKILLNLMREKIDNTPAVMLLSTPLW